MFENRHTYRAPGLVRLGALGIGQPLALLVSWILFRLFGREIPTPASDSGMRGVVLLRHNRAELEEKPGRAIV